MAEEEKLGRGQGAKENWIWAITFAIWAAGIWPIEKLWYFQPFGNQGLNAVFGYAVYVAAFFYVFALIPIRKFVGLGWRSIFDKHRCRRPSADG